MSSSTRNQGKFEFLLNLKQNCDRYFNPCQSQTPRVDSSSHGKAQLLQKALTSRRSFRVKSFGQVQKSMTDRGPIKNNYRKVHTKSQDIKSNQSSMPKFQGISLLEKLSIGKIHQDNRGEILQLQEWYNNALLQNKENWNYKDSKAINKQAFNQCVQLISKQCKNLGQLVMQIAENTKKDHKYKIKLYKNQNLQQRKESKLDYRNLQLLKAKEFAKLNKKVEQLSQQYSRSKRNEQKLGKNVKMLEHLLMESQRLTDVSFSSSDSQNEIKGHLHSFSQKTWQSEKSTQTQMNSACSTPTNRQSNLQSPRPSNQKTFSSYVKGVDKLTQNLNQLTQNIIEKKNSLKSLQQSISYYINNDSITEVSVDKSMEKLHIVINPPNEE